MHEPEEIRRALNRVVRLLVKECEPQKIALYRSFAYGEPDESSNIDLLVVLDSQETPYHRTVRRRRLLRDPYRRIPRTAGPHSGRAPAATGQG